MKFAFIYFLKKYPKLFPVLALAHFLEIMLEIIGISLFIPLLNFLLNNSSDSYIELYITEFFNSLNIQLNLENLLGIICLLFLTKSLFVLSLRYITAGLSAKFIEETTEEAIVNISQLSIDEFQALNRGEICNVLTEQLKRSSSIILWLMMIVASTISLILYLCLASIISIRLLVVSVVAISLFYGIISFVLRKAKGLGKDRADLAIEHNRTLLEFLEHFKYAKAIHKEKELSERASEIIETLAINWQKVQFLSNSIVGAFQPILAISLSVVILYAVRWDIPFSELVVFLVTLQRAYPAITNIQNMKNNVIIHSSELQRAIDLRTSLSAKTSFTKLQTIPYKIAIYLENISYSFGKLEILSDISMKIKKGETLFIHGESGKGKSTLIDIILGLRKPSNGRVFIDDVELNDNNSFSWREHISYIPQSDILFNSSIKENIAYLSEDTNPIALNESIQLAGLSEFVGNLQENFAISDSSDNLSGGQKQRLMIARGIFMDRDVFIFDEPTSALDSNTIGVIVSALKYLQKKGKTIVIVSHDMQLKSLADKVIELI